MAEEFSEEDIIRTQQASTKSDSLNDPLRGQKVPSPDKTKIGYCPMHPDSLMNVYCQDCEESLCSNCTSSHENHDYASIEQIFPKNKREISLALKPIEEQLSRAETALEHFEAKKREIIKGRFKLEAEISDILDQLKAKKMEELRKIATQKLKSLEEQQEKVVDVQKKLSHCSEKVKIKLTTLEHIIKKKKAIIDDIEQIRDEFKPDDLTSNTHWDIKLEHEIPQLQEICDKLILSSQVQKETQTLPGRSILNQTNEFNYEHNYILKNEPKFVTKNEHSSVVMQPATGPSTEPQISASLIHVKNGNKRVCSFTKYSNGEYNISYQPAYRGQHELHLSVNRIPIKGSPFQIPVIPRPGCQYPCISTISGLNNPRGVAMNSQGQIIVVESGSYISIFTSQGQKIQTFGAPGVGDGQLSNAHGVTVDKDDNIIVAECGCQRIQKFNSEGIFVTKVGSYGNESLQFCTPFEIYYNHNDDNLYIVDRDHHRIQVITSDLTQQVRSFGSKGSGINQFINPRGIAFDSRNRLYVTDSGNQCIKIFTADGQYLKSFAQKKNQQIISSPYLIAIDSSDTVYVSENGLHCVSVFNPSGVFITTFGMQGIHGGQFNNVLGLAIDINDSLVVADSSNNRLQVF